MCPFALARIFHESLAATTDMAVLPGVLGRRLLRRTVQVRLGSNPLRLPGGPTIFVISRQQFMKYPGLGVNWVVS
jgi:hypothetical protein